jgi:hypothetical protein
MAREVEITEQDIHHIQEKLNRERATMSVEDQALLDAILRKAQMERSGQAHTAAGWTFTWTYRF